MKRCMLMLTGLGSLLATATVGAAEFAGNVTLATDYRFRGISQLDRSPAVQAGFDLTLDSGLYVGTWASNVNFSDGAIEQDYYAGYAADIDDSSSYDAGVLWYNYPHDGASPDLDYWEAYGSFTFQDATVGLNYSPDYFAETGWFVYVYGDYSLPLGERLSLGLHLGYNRFEGDDEFAAFIGPGPGENPGDDYIDYGISVSTAQMGLDLALALIGTDLDDEECFGDTELCAPSLVFSVSKSL